MVDLSYVLSGLGLSAAVITAVVAFRKTKPDVTAVLVDAASDVVIIQKTVIEELQAGLAEAKRQISELQSLEVEVAALRIELSDVRKDNARLRAENTKLKNRVKHLEDGDVG